MILPDRDWVKTCLLSLIVGHMYFTIQREITCTGKLFINRQSAATRLRN